MNLSPEKEDTAAVKPSNKTSGVCVKKPTKITQSSVKQMTREELEACVLQLQAHNVQLKSLLQRSLTTNQNQDSKQLPQAKKGKSTKKEKHFDFDKHSTRHILLKFAYLGWDYQGYAVQEDTLNTIEADLFEALLKTKLIKNRQTSNYHRCGRTDKGVSAFSQVISITVRSQLLLPDVCLSKELKYVDLLNRVLPDHIRMLAWCPAPDNFSARFDCLSRTYKYFFPLGGLNLQRMRDAGKLLEGHHDFRNLCKMDVGNGVVNFERHIDSVSIELLQDEYRAGAGQAFASDAEPATDDSSIKSSDLQSTVLRNENQTFGSDDTKASCTILKEEASTQDQSETMKGGESDNMNKVVNNNDNNSNYRPFETSSPNGFRSSSCSIESEDNTADSPAPGYNMCVATIKGKAFLWHQIRAIMAILLLVGLGKENPSVVNALLDVKKHPRKPQYSLACEVPLCLFDSEFPADVVQWRYSASAIHKVQCDLQKLWAHHAIRSSMVQRMLHDVSRVAECRKTVTEQHSFLAPLQAKQYQPLLQRKTCESLEARVRHFVKRRRLDAGVLNTVAGEPADSKAT